MKKIYFWSILTLIIATFLPGVLLAQENASANSAGDAVAQRETHVTPAQALNVGYTFMRTGTGTRSGGTHSSEVREQAMQLVYTGQAYDSLTGNTTDCYYVFSLQPKGFVIVAADDRVEPILGYSYDNDFVVTNMPTHVRGWLGNYEQQIQEVAKSNLQAEPATQTKWTRLKSGQSMSTRSGDTVVGPLLTTTWDQGQYYNALCPEDANGPDGHALTGCVATAMAQIINHWGYPIHGRGTHSYNVSGLDPGSFIGDVNTTGYGTLYVNYDSATYDYTHMPDALTATSTPQEISAVAQLMHHCGVAVNMMYGPSSSGAIEEDVRSALISYYGFAPTLGYAQRQMYTEATWTDSLRANIDRGEPVFYSRSNLHAFVLDGYKQDGFFHFNFGWSGFGDGWYQISAINPSMELNDWQTAIMGIRPDSNSHAVICHKKMNVQNRDVYTVSEPIILMPLRGGSSYLAANEMTGVRINLSLMPEDSLGQLVLDVIDFGREQSVVIYDGLNKDSVLRVIETRSNVLFYGNTPLEGLLQQLAGTDFSPIVSTRHGFTVEVYSDSRTSEGFHLQVSDASDCRMVSNLTAVQNVSGVLVSWTENGNATQWQVKVDENEYIVDSTHILLTSLTSNDSYNVQVRSVCESDNYSSWNSITKKVCWTDVVTSEPDGYLLDGDTIRITSPEGLAWVAHCVDSLYLIGIEIGALNLFYQYDHRSISIENDIDLSGYIWQPISLWHGNIDGHGHLIRNMDVSTALYGGLFSRVFSAHISNIGMVNSKVNVTGPAGSIAGEISNCNVVNCFSENYLISTGNNDESGGLFGAASEGYIINCYAYGENYSQFGYGGLVGSLSNSEITNCVTQNGEGTAWAYQFWPPERRGLITRGVTGGSFSNCFSEISPFVENIIFAQNRIYAFLGDHYNVYLAENLAAFNIAEDTLCMPIADIAVNYTLGDDIDVITALNNKLEEYNSPYLRTWVRDSITHLPVFGDYYEVTCPNVSNITAENIPYNGGFAVALSWQENGESDEWQVKYNIRNASDDSAVVYSTNTLYDTLELPLGHEYSFYVRPICSSDTVGWGLPFNFYVDKILWVDVVTTQPEGYYEDDNGNVTVSTPEALVWAAKRMWYDEEDTLFIVSDLDMGAYRWTPISRYDFRGTIEGNNHIISNLYCRENINDENTIYIGLVGRSKNASFNNIVIENGTFIGNHFVGSLVGYVEESSFVNCHALNTHVKGLYEVGGLGGSGYSCVTYNCSSTGLVSGDQGVGGLFGSYGVSIARNCYSNCDVQPLGMRNERSYEGRGGLFGSCGGSINNCYSAGIVGSLSTDYENVVGSSIGLFYYGELDNVYSQKNGGLSIVGTHEFGDVSDAAFFSDTSSIVNGSLQTVVTIADTTYTDLLSALNAWVDANDTAGIYRHWAADSTGTNGGFPVFAAIPCIPVTVNDSITACDSYVWNDSVYTQSGDYTQTFTNATGCDSVVTLHLTISQSFSGVESVSANESYTWADSLYTASGIYEHTWTTAEGCDSTVSLWLTITKTQYDTTYVEVHDTTYLDVHDTTYVDVYVPIHDTTYVDVYVPVHDTTYMDIHDTTYVDVPYPVHDTTYVNVHDTTYLWQYDTTFVTLHDTTVLTLHDTTYINVPYPVHDTTYVTLTDTIVLNHYDTTYVTLTDTIVLNHYDTTYIDIPYPVHDTTYVTLTDTIVLNHYDTTYITLHDTITITEPLTWYSLQVLSEDMDKGVGAGSGQFPEGTDVEIAAIPVEGYRFLQWSDGSEANPRTITLNESLTLTAMFTTVGVTDLELPTWYVYPEQGAFVVKGTGGHQVSVYDAVGKLLHRYSNAPEILRYSVPAAGSYYIQVDNGAAKKVTVVR